MAPFPPPQPPAHPHCRGFNGFSRARPSPAPGGLIILVLIVSLQHNGGRKGWEPTLKPMTPAGSCAPDSPRLSRQGEAKTWRVSLVGHRA